MVYAQPKLILQVMQAACAIAVSSKHAFVYSLYSACNVHKTRLGAAYQKKLKLKLNQCSCSEWYLEIDFLEKVSMKHCKAAKITKYQSFKQKIIWSPCTLPSGACTGPMANVLMVLMYVYTIPWKRERVLVWDTTCLDTLAPSYMLHLLY